MTTDLNDPERAWARQAKAEASAKHPNDPVAAQWAYHEMVMARGKSRGPTSRPAGIQPAPARVGPR